MLADVSGEKGVTANVLGDINGTITSTQGPINLMVYGDIKKNVTADGAKGAISAATWGEGGKLSACKGPVNVDFAYGDATGGITAGTNASLFTWGNVTSDIAAGTNVDVFARKNITANIAGLQSGKSYCGR